jgi:putative ABC transport system permease protein
MLGNDLRSAARHLRRHPGFAALAVLTLVLGLGSTLAVVTVVDTVLFRSLPYPEPDRLVRIWPDVWFTKKEVQEFERQARAFEHIGAYFAWDKAALATDGPPVVVEAAMVSVGFFDTLAVAPSLGRGFRSGEDRPGDAPPIVLSESLWRREFAGSNDVLGRQVRVDGQPHVVVGVMPPSVRYPRNEIELWRPLLFDPSDAVDFESAYVQLIGRLPPGLSLQLAEEDGRRVAGLMTERLGQRERRGSALGVVPLHRHVVGDVRPALLSLLGAVALVMAIAIVNVANLLLARGGERSREFAVRLALGAGRSGLARLVVVESGLIATVGGALSIPFAWAALRALRPVMPPDLPRLADITIDWRIAAIGASLSAVAALAAAFIPAARAARDDVHHGLRDGGGARVVVGRRRLRAALVVAQVALAVVLASGAGLLAKSLMRLSEVPLGLQTENVIGFRPMLPRAWFDDFDRARRAYARIVQRVRDLPGVEAAGGIHMIPIENRGFGGELRVEGAPEPLEPQFVNWRVVTPGYFETVRVPLIRGRLLDEWDIPDRTDVAVVNRRLARACFGDADPIGRRFRHSLEGPDWITVVGVVGDVHQHGADRPVQPEAYRPLAQVRRPVGLALMVRSPRSPDALVPVIRKAVRGVEPDVPIASARVMRTVVRDSMVRQRLVAQLIGALAGLALLLGALGTYGVLTADVISRTREIGVRMAVGARPADVLWLVLRRALAVVSLGLIIGLPLALALSRALSSQLFHVAPSDPSTYVAVTAALLGVAGLAAAVPARRAAATDPLSAIRHE